MTIDRTQFERHMGSGSRFEILLRGHLWIENLINQILEVHMVDKSSLDIDRMAFRLKIDVAQALGFVQAEDGISLRKLNSLRNRLAHNLLAEPSDNEIKDLIATSSGVAKAAFDAMLTATDASYLAARDINVVHLRYWIYCYVMHLDHVYAMQKYESENRTKLLQVTAVQVALEMTGQPATPIEQLRQRFDLAPPPDIRATWQRPRADQGPVADA